MESAVACFSLTRSLLSLIFFILTFSSKNVSSFSNSRFDRHVGLDASSSTQPTMISTLSSPSPAGETRHTRDSHVIRLHAKSKGSSDAKNEEVVTLIHSHHLLDHKPDNMIVTGKKFKLRGVACLGRPGVALCIGSRNNVKKFMGKLRGAMPQKKFASVEIEANEGDAAASSSSDSAVSILDEAVDGFEEVPISELRELLTVVGQEDRFFALLGIDNNSPKKSGQTRNSNVSDTGNSNNNSGAGRKNGKKRS